jgi:hypothetical protein
MMGPSHVYQVSDERAGRAEGKKYSEEVEGLRAVGVALRFRFHKNLIDTHTL